MPKIQLSVFDDGLISKWDHALPKTKRFAAQEGAPVKIELTRKQMKQIVEARLRAEAITGYDGPVRYR